MFPNIDSELIHLRQQELLREAERAQVVAAFSERGRWRKRTGSALIRLGTLLGGRPASPAPRARAA